MKPNLQAGWAEQHPQGAWRARRNYASTWLWPPLCLGTGVGWWGALVFYGSCTQGEGGSCSCWAPVPTWSVLLWRQTCAEMFRSCLVSSAFITHPLPLQTGKAVFEHSHFILQAWVTALVRFKMSFISIQTNWYFHLVEIKKYKSISFSFFNQNMETNQNSCLIEPN